MARGREPGLELREDVDTVLAPGMILSMEPMLMVPEVELSKLSTYINFGYLRIYRRVSPGPGDTGSTTAW